MPRVITVTAWIPPLPPMPATTGMKTASATTCSSARSNRPTTQAARKQVARFASIQGSRRRTESSAGEKTRSSSERPASRYMSSVASSWITSITSSTVITPSMRPSASVTGIASRS